MNWPGSPLTRTLRRNGATGKSRTDGERKGCCSDGKSAAFKDHKYFCKDPTDWLPDKTYSGPEMSNSETSCKDWVEVDVDIKDEDFTQSWSCDGKSERSSRTFRSWVPTSWVAAAPPNSPRATKNGAMYAPIPLHFFRGKLSIATTADSAVPATWRYT